MTKKKKKYPFNVLSDVECRRPGCHNKLKLRIVEEKDPTKPRICFSCHKERECARGHQMG